jgi:hypothetical protein
MNDPKKYMLKIEGQELTIPTEVGGLQDADLKRALTPMFPGAANSKIERVEKDGTVTITVIKLAGSKGSGRRSSSRKKGGGLAALLCCKSRRNPAVQLYLKMHAQNVNALDPTGLIALADDIDSTLAAGIKQNQQILAALARLIRAAPKEGTFVPWGF